MAYLTPAQLIAHYGEREMLQLSDRENTGAVVTPVLQSAIDRGAALLDAALARCYAMPLRSVGGGPLSEWNQRALEEWNGRFARYLLWDDLRLSGAPDAQMHESARRYDEVRRRLEALDPGKRGGCAMLAGVELSPASVDANVDSSALMFGDSGQHWGRGSDGFSGTNRRF